jgi:hypothetical protein
MQVTYMTPRATASYVDDNATPPPGHTGLYRNPLPMSDGTFVAVHTDEKRLDRNEGTRSNPVSRYKFRLKTLKQVGGFWVPDQLLTPGLANNTSYYDPDVFVRYSGELWELDPVEVRPRSKPARIATHLPVPEQQVFTDEGVAVSDLQDYLRQNNLALVVSRNVTTRDHADKQQPFNLQIAGTSTQTLGAGGKIYPLAHLQFFQADQIRGIGMHKSTDTPRAGRRVIAQAMHDSAVDNPPNATGPVASVKLGDDGSMAAFVPARRALTWHLTDPTGASVVKERYWLTFQPGEIRTCTSCHGLNTKDQANHPTPTNSPAALRTLLQYWKTKTGDATPRITSAIRLANGQAHLQMKGIPSKVHIIQTTTDLVHWLPIGTNLTDSNVLFQYDDANAGSFPARFYRLLIP